MKRKVDKTRAGESERTLRILRVKRILREVFTSAQVEDVCLNTPDRCFNNKTPLEMLTTGVGAVRVESLALAMVHGVPL